MNRHTLPTGKNAVVGLPTGHLILVLAVVAIWGTNFVVIREGLEHFPPLLLAALRFLFSAFPAVLFLARPRAPWIYVTGYGLLLGVGQFGLLYIAMDGHIAPGLASLIMQLQVPFTIVMAAIFLSERLRARQAFSFGLCAAGVTGIAFGSHGSANLLGLALVLCAAASWALANILVKKLGAVSILNFIVWASAVSVVPLFAMSLMFEGPQTIASSLRNADVGAWSTVLWQSVGNTLFGFAAWSWLLARHPAAIIMPAAILVPVFGLGSAAVILGEPMPLTKLVGSTLILVGVGLELALARRATKSDSGDVGATTR